MSISAAAVGVWVGAVLALRVSGDVVWVEVVGGAADGVVDDGLLRLHCVSD